MKILHTSDWHLGMLVNGADISEDQKHFIDQIRGIVRDEGIDVVLIAGDIFDRANVSGDAIKMYDDAVTGLCSTDGAKTVIIAGNHDGAERLAQCSRLLEGSGLFIAGALTRPVMKAGFDDTDIYMLPWVDTARVRYEFPEKAEEITGTESALRVICDSIREDMDRSKRNILVSHAFIINAETSVSDRTAEIGFASAVSADVFDGFDYVALGHIHKPQDITETIRYCGTPMPYSFGREETQEKSVTIIDTADMSRRVVPLKLLHERNTLRGTFDELMKGDVPEEVRKGFVRVELTDRFLGTETMLALRGVYPNILEGRGLTYDEGGAKATMTAEDLKHAGSDPAAIFRSFCVDVIGAEPDDKQTVLFMKALEGAEEEVLQ
ncbi:MAG: metallophosphoesterase family protein [Bacillota bacterium]